MHICTPAACVPLQTLLYAHVSSMYRPSLSFHFENPILLLQMEFYLFVGTIIYGFSDLFTSTFFPILGLKSLEVDNGSIEKSKSGIGAILSQLANTLIFLFHLLVIKHLHEYNKLIIHHSNFIGFHERAIIICFQGPGW